MTKKKYLQEIKSINAHLVSMAKNGKTMEEVDRVKDSAEILFLTLIINILKSEFPDEEDFVNASLERQSEILAEETEKLG